jgi:hypothetical protein
MRVKGILGTMALVVAAVAITLLTARFVYAAPSAPEQALIETLIQDVAQHKTMKFLRNGQEHPASEAARHLRAKYEHFKDEIVTAEDFIRLCGTRSEMTQAPYQVRLGDNSTRDSAEFLMTELRKLRLRSRS